VAKFLERIAGTRSRRDTRASIECSREGIESSSCRPIPTGQSITDGIVSMRDASWVTTVLRARSTPF